MQVSMQLPLVGLSRNFPPEHEVQLSAAIEQVAQKSAELHALQLSICWYVSSGQASTQVLSDYTKYRVS